MTISKLMSTSRAMFPAQISMLCTSLTFLLFWRYAYLAALYSIESLAVLFWALTFLNVSMRNSCSSTFFISTLQWSIRSWPVMCSQSLKTLLSKLPLIRKSTFWVWFGNRCLANSTLIFSGSSTNSTGCSSSNCALVGLMWRWTYNSKVALRSFEKKVPFKDAMIRYF